MARSITLTLGAGLGTDLGPNFNLTADVGSVTPSTATKSELTAGKSVSVDDLATEVTITSTGTCTNAITQTIPCVGGTTTTTTTSTTTAAPVCNEWYLYTNGNPGDAGCFDYFDCANTPQNVCIDEFNSATICAIGTPVQVSGTGCNSSNQGPCTTTTTTTAATTTTTTSPNVDIYITTVLSLDIGITDMRINGVSVTYAGGANFPLAAGDNGSFTSTQTGVQDVEIDYTTSIPGQHIIFTDSGLFQNCLATNGTGGTMTVIGADITAGTTISVAAADGGCP